MDNVRRAALARRCKREETEARKRVRTAAPELLAVAIETERLHAWHRKLMSDRTGEAWRNNADDYKEAVKLNDVARRAAIAKAEGGA